MKRIAGTTIQISSSIFGGSISCASSLSGRRRYLMAKKKMTSQVRSDTVPVTTMRAMKSASTGPANVDARSGHRGKSLTIAALPLLTNHDDDEAGQRHDGCRSAGAHEVQDVTAVATGGRVIVVAEKKKLIAGRSNLSAGCFDDAEAKIARLELEAVEIA